MTNGPRSTGDGEEEGEGLSRNHRWVSAAGKSRRLFSFRPLTLIRKPLHLIRTAVVVDADCKSPTSLFRAGIERPGTGRSHKGDEEIEARGWSLGLQSWRGESVASPRESLARGEKHRLTDPRRSFQYGSGIDKTSCRMRLCNR